MGVADIPNKCTYATVGTYIIITVYTTSYSQTPLARAYGPLSQSLPALCIIHTVSCPSE